jgi:hypothetical protein
LNIFDFNPKHTISDTKVNDKILLLLGNIVTASSISFKPPVLIIITYYSVINAVVTIELSKIGRLLPESDYTEILHEFYA